MLCLPLPTTARNSRYALLRPLCVRPGKLEPPTWEPERQPTLAVGRAIEAPLPRWRPRRPRRIGQQRGAVSGFERGSLSGSTAALRLSAHRRRLGNRAGPHSAKQPRQDRGRAAPAIRRADLAWVAIGEEPQPAFDKTAIDVPVLPCVGDRSPPASGSRAACLTTGHAPCTRYWRSTMYRDAVRPLMLYAGSTNDLRLCRRARVVGPRPVEDQRHR